MSRALELRNRVLMMDSVQALDLSDRVNLPDAVVADLAPELARARHVLVVGRSLAGLADRALGAALPHGARVDVVDEDVAPLSLEPGAEIRHFRAGLDDYAADPEAIDRDLGDRPLVSFADLRDRLARIDAARRERPLIPDASKGLVVHDLVANRLDRAGFARALAESFRVLALDGTLCSVALLADEPFQTGRLRVAAVPADLHGLPLETEVPAMLRGAGFHGVTLHLLHDAPVLVRERVEVRAFVVRAYKGTQGSCYDEGHAVVYKGPWSTVADDDDHVYRRGERAAVCRKTYDLLMRAPYQGQFIGLPRYQAPTSSEVLPFDCNTPKLRHPGVTKGLRPLGASESLKSCCDSTPEKDSCC